MYIFGHLRKSEKRLLEVLANSTKDKKIAQKGIINSTGLSERTVKYALKNLVSSGYLIERPVLSDMRSKVYFVHERSDDTDEG